MSSAEPAPAAAADPTGLRIFPVTGLGEVEPGDDLAALLLDALTVRSGGHPTVPDGLVDGDVLVVTQKVVSKAEGRLVAIDADDPAAKRELVERESVRIVRRRDELLITETRHGFICANAGVDLSNVGVGTAALLPVDPDGSAAAIRDHLELCFSVTPLAVVVSDTHGRAFRKGNVNVAIGSAGVVALGSIVGGGDVPALLTARTS